MPSSKSILNVRGSVRAVLLTLGLRLLHHLQGQMTVIHSIRQQRVMLGATQIAISLHQTALQLCASAMVRDQAQDLLHPQRHGLLRLDQTLAAPQCRMPQDVQSVPMQRSATSARMALCLTRSHALPMPAASWAVRNVIRATFVVASACSVHQTTTGLIAHLGTR